MSNSEKSTPVDTEVLRTEAVKEMSEENGDEPMVIELENQQQQVSGNSAEVWLETKCVFCKNDLAENSEPKLLPCLHSACKSCLAAESVPSPASNNSADNSAPAKQVMCPICHQDVTGDESIDHLFLLEQLTNNSDNRSDDENRKNLCTSCDDNASASGFCTDCEEWLCEMCIQAHQRVRVTKDHSICSKEDMEGEKANTLGQKYLFCPLHRQKHLKLYCETCSKLICQDCQLLEHKEHNYQFLSDACDQHKQYLINLTQREETGTVKKKIASILVAGAVGVACVAACPVVLSAVGFGAAGVTAGSVAAGVQSMIGASVAKGSIFALAQSAGAAGTAVSTKVAIGTVAGIATRLVLRPWTKDQ